ncbi:hypothetical protein ACNQFZ_08065 [Schinkia sp. CFF1]
MVMNQMLRLIKQLSGRVSSSMYASVSNQQDAARIAFLRQLEREMKEKEAVGHRDRYHVPT